MSDYQYDGPIAPDFDKPWVARRMAQLEAPFRNFLTSEDGRLYFLFGGERSGRTTLLKIIEQHAVAMEARTLPVFVDMKMAGSLPSVEKFLQSMFDHICLDICYPYPRKVARFFNSREMALPDFREAFNDILRSSDTRVQGARFLFLVDNADELARVAFADELFKDIITLLSGADYINDVARYLNIVMTGGAPLYNQAVAANFPRKYKYWYNIEALPENAARALVETMPGMAASPDLAASILRLTGRQPYLLQYFMAQLDDLVGRGEPLTHAAVEQVATACLEPRSRDNEVEPWFYDCFEVIKAQGAFPIYAGLAARQSLTWPEIRDIIKLQKPDARLSPLEQADRALDTLLFYGLVEQAADEAYVVTGELFKRWFEMNYPASGGAAPDLYTHYEAGMRRLLEQMGRDHPRYRDALVFQQRLSENIARARQYGERDDFKSERAEIVDQINALSNDVLGVYLFEQR